MCCFEVGLCRCYNKQGISQPIYYSTLHRKNQDFEPTILHHL